MEYEPEPLPSYKELSNIFYTIEFTLRFTLVNSSLHPTSWSHHLSSQLYPGIRSAPAQSSYIVCQVTYAVMVVFRLWMYSLIGQSFAASSTSSTGGYSHSPSSIRRSVIPGIHWSARWWKPPTLLSLIFPPPNSCSHISVPYAPMIYRALHRTAQLLTSLSAPLRLFPRFDEPSTGCDTWPTNRYYYMW